jgi:hypothetical protein
MSFDPRRSSSFCDGLFRTNSTKPGSIPFVIIRVRRHACDPNRECIVPPRRSEYTGHQGRAQTGPLLAMNCFLRWLFWWKSKRTLTSRNLIVGCPFDISSFTAAEIYSPKDLFPQMPGDQLPRITYTFGWDGTDEVA